jgi:hypothetical protein
VEGGVLVGTGGLATPRSGVSVVVGEAGGVAVGVGEPTARVGEGRGTDWGRGAAQAERTRTSKHAASKRSNVFNGKKFFLGLS